MVREGSGLPLCIVRPSIIGASYDEPIQVYKLFVHAKAWIEGVTSPVVHICVSSNCIKRLPLRCSTSRETGDDPRQAIFPNPFLDALPLAGLLPAAAYRLIP